MFYSSASRKAWIQTVYIPVPELLSGKKPSGLTEKRKSFKVVLRLTGYDTPATEGKTAVPRQVGYHLRRFTSIYPAEMLR
jgi:hypothetical protein